MHAHVFMLQKHCSVIRPTVAELYASTKACFQVHLQCAWAAVMCENMHLVQVAEAAEGMQVLKAELEVGKAAANALSKGAASRARQVFLSQTILPHTW